MLAKKMFRDIWENKVQFILIFLMIFLGAFLYSGLSSEYHGLAVNTEAYYESSNAANIWVYGNQIDDQELRRIENMATIKEVEKRLVIEGSVQNTFVELNVVNDYQISTLQVVEGESFSKKGVFIDSQFAKTHDLTVGDSVTIETEIKSITTDILGLVMSPDYIYYTREGDIIPSPSDYGYAYLSKDFLPEAAQGQYSQILLTTTTENYTETTKEIEKILSDSPHLLITRERQRGYQMIADKIEQHRGIGFLFPIAFLVIAMLTIVSTMIRLISKQESIIATLKGLGFKRARLVRHYLAYSFFITSLGAVLGMISGPLVIPPLFYSVMENAFSLPVWHPILAPQFFILPIGLVGISSLISYSVCRSFLTLLPAEKRVMPGMKVSRFQQGARWLRLGFTTQWNTRDSLRHKSRSLMVILGIAGCTGLVLCGLGLNDTIAHLVDVQFHKLSQFKTQIKLEGDDQLVSIQGERIMDGTIELRIDTNYDRVSLTVYEAHPKLTSFIDQNNQAVTLADTDLAISNKLAKMYHLDVGDKINWRFLGEGWNQGVITKLIYTPAGQGLSMTEAKLRSFAYDFTPTRLLTGNADDHRLDAPTTQLSELETATLETYETFNIMFYLMIGAGVSMAFVVLYSLGNISLAERQFDFATLRVLGFKTRSVRLLLVQQNVIFTIIGLPLGFLFGYQLLFFLTKNAGETIDLQPTITLLTYGICAAITVIASLLINFRFSRRVKDINMVEALKSNE